MIKWDKPCYKCLSHFCDLSCKEPEHLKATQQKQEPVAWRYRMPIGDGHWIWNYATYINDPKDQRCEPLYATPPQRKPLSSEDIEQCCYEADSVADDHCQTWKWTEAFAKAIEAAHGIKP